ncbi:hypothetical protein GCM10009634_44040 [Saccharothrix xinjiangensis]
MADESEFRAADSEVSTAGLLMPPEPQDASMSTTAPVFSISRARPPAALMIFLDFTWHPTSHVSHPPLHHQVYTPTPY